jgi:outer membrane PBP1 activator LpoA protein
MQRISFWFFLVSALYVSELAYATDAAPAASAVAVQPVPHIALLLPLKSAIFGHAAEIVQQGFLSAASRQPQTLPVRVYKCADENTDIIALYQQAIAGGARAVAGPLTRNGVAVLANYPGITVPSLALNFADGKSADKLYFFGLTAEMEARQIAQLAASAGLHSASIVSSGTPLSRRLSQAFAGEWKIHGGHISKEILYQDNPAVLADLPATEGNMVFLAADAETAHLIRPYLNNALPVYATSQLFNGNTDTLTNFDLNDVRFIDMPWLLQPDHPAVMIYPRANPPLESDMERLYALGIDAFRLLQIMLDNSYRTSLPLDGVTGRIRLNANRQFQREAIPAQFWLGRGLTPEEVAAQEATLAAARAAAASGILPASAPAVIPMQ